MASRASLKKKLRKAQRKERQANNKIDQLQQTIKRYARIAGKYGDVVDEAKRLLQNMKR